MPMIDIGIIIEISTAGSSTSADPTAPVASGGWTKLKDCTSLPALMSPSSKITTDFVGDKYTGEIAGKKGITGLDFTFAYDGGGSGDQFRALSDMETAGTKHWLRVTYPDGTKFELLVSLEVALAPVSPSAEVDYNVSFIAHRPALAAFGGNLINIVWPSGSDPLES